MTEYQYVRVAAAEGVVLVTMNDPATANANSTPHMIDELVDVLGRINTDIAAKVVVITGAGRTFSSGGLLELMESYQDLSPIETRNFYLHHGIHKLYRVLHALEVPTIAAVNGPAYGSGFGMALMCDLRIASSQARFVMNFAKLGILPGDGGAMFLLRAVGHQQAARIMFSAAPVSAVEARELGIVLQVTEPDKLMEVAMALAADIAANPALNMRSMKRLLRHAHGAELESFVDLTVAMQALSHHTPEHVRALQEMRHQIKSRKP